MVNYRRHYEPGGCYFFTVTLQDRRSKLLTENITLLQQIIASVKHRQPYKTIAAVILPDHMHAIWRLPPNDSDYPGRWKKIKSMFTFILQKNGMVLDKNKRGECNVWQKRYWEHTIRDEEDLERCVDYIHYNPVKHGLVENVIDWPYSSFHQYVKNGILDADWGNDFREGGKSGRGRIDVLIYG